MLHIRVVKTKGRSRAVQVYQYGNSKRVIIKHMGSATTDEQISTLEEMARVFITDYTKQSCLFEEGKPKAEAVLVSQCEYIGIYYTFFSSLTLDFQKSSITQYWRDGMFDFKKNVVSQLFCIGYIFS